MQGGDREKSRKEKRRTGGATEMGRRTGVVKTT